MDTIEVFIEKFKAQFELLEDHEVVNEQTEFKEMDSWDSLTSIMVINMIEDEYAVTIDGNSIFGVDTVSELYNKITIESSNK